MHPPPAHPYRELPDKAFWKRAVALPAKSEVDPVGEFRLRLDRTMRVATAGSCFAQHLSRHLRASGYHHYVAEPGHPLIPAARRTEQGYGLYSARYGNVYTARQLLQTFERAFGSFAPAEPAWTTTGGAIVDPFRPTVQPGGFIDAAEMLADRRQHLAHVRRMFETLDVFIFTLGLTECWRSTEDGAVFPICPGVEGGSFSAERHAFHNQPVDEVITDLSRLTEALLAVNPRAQLVLTVSPVPLVATATPGAHVLSATSYSKAVLRVAADTIVQRFPAASYFPSYEIITGPHSRGSYFDADLRSVREEGVAHVMRLFLAHASGTGPDAAAPAPGDAQAQAHAEFDATSAALVEVECDETALDR
ncbi:GSCFA domain-containing protein [Aquabacterium sp.]|uniref:GSCFA domain-containing protein n=1 Tax=Aquabacterium sp. TaxID=1872578 RepID=UPI002CA948FF|nr:GSCFA domain-containing protein [Aquabacterium sp.]HSW07412.1 GSCFA domain-containing protein [Aquabacterium sp.]